MFKAPRLFFLMVMTASFFSNPIAFADDQNLYPGFPPIEESKAYQFYKARPITEYSEVIYLIDRFVDAQVEVVYDGRYFSAKFVSRLARWFLARNYRKETAEQWIMKWCNTSVPAGNLVWVKMPNQKFKLSREILLDELKALRKLTTVAEEPKEESTIDIQSPVLDTLVTETNTSIKPVEESIRSNKTKTQALSS